MSSPIRIGVVGIGFGQQGHVPAFRVDSRCTVTAICASTIERAQKVAETLNIEKYFGDWKKLVFSKDVDAISIAVPPALQTHIAVEALNQGKPVLCEKPLSISAAGARLMTDIAAKSNLANVVDFEFPEIPQWRQAKALIDSESLGSIHYVSVSWQLQTYANRMGLESWKTNNDEGGGVLNAFVSHCFYYIEWLLGPVEKLMCTLSKSSLDKRQGDTIALLNLTLFSGTVVTMNVCTDAPFGRKHHLEFHGDRATLVLTNSTDDYINGFELYLGDRNSKQLEPVAHGDNKQIENRDGRVQAVSSLTTRFIDWVIKGVPSKPAFADGLRVQELIEKAQQSARSERWVNCQEEDL